MTRAGSGRAGASPTLTLSPTPATTLIGGRQVELAEVAAIEAAVRAYLDALGSGDLEALERRCAGDLRRLS
jgi:hypothetical protein